MHVVSIPGEIMSLMKVVEVIQMNERE